MHDICPTCGTRFGSDDFKDEYSITKCWDRLRIEWLDEREWHDFAIVCQSRLGYALTDLCQLQRDYQFDTKWKQVRRAKHEQVTEKLVKWFHSEVVPEGWKSGDRDPMLLWESKH